MKKLICADDIHKLVKQGEKTLCIAPGMILTPSAKDAAKSAKLELCEATSEADCIACKAAASAEEASTATTTECDAPSTDGDISSDTIYAALKTMLNKGLLDGVTDASPATPYSSEAEGGVKLVRGKSVTMEVLDTGTPGAKACFSQVIGAGDDGSHVGAGFLEIDDSRFEWVMEGYEEIDYVIEGTLTISINDKTFTAKAGDVFFVPSGANVVWGSPDNAKVFFATYVTE